MRSSVSSRGWILQICGIVGLVASAVRHWIQWSRFGGSSPAPVRYVDELRHKAGVSLLHSRTIKLALGTRTGSSGAFVRGFDGKIVVWLRKRRPAILRISRYAA